jgi:hypothetical protein
MPREGTWKNRRRRNHRKLCLTGAGGPLCSTRPSPGCRKNTQTTKRKSNFRSSSHVWTRQPAFAADTPLDTMRKVVEEEPMAPTRGNPKLNRDLEIICLKCLEKDPSRRYPSALALAEDLERWVRSEPIQARANSPSERMLKWARRRPAIAALSGLALFLAGAGICGVAWQWRRAEHHAQTAERALVQARDALWQANFDRAHALRTSGRIGQRVKALEAVRAAVAIRPSPELRDEAAAALALPDLEDEGKWLTLPPNRGVVADSLLRHFATLDDHGLTVRRFADGTSVCRINQEPGAFFDFALSPDGDCVALLSASILRVWEVASTNLVMTLSNIVNWDLARTANTSRFGVVTRSGACVFTALAYVSCLAGRAASACSPVTWLLIQQVCWRSAPKIQSG